MIQECTSLFSFIPMRNLVLNKEMSTANPRLHEMQSPCRGNCAEIKINKDIKEIQQYTHTPSQIFAYVDGHSCWTSCMTQLMLQSSRQAEQDLPPFCPPSNLMNSLPTATGYMLFHTNCRVTAKTQFYHFSPHFPVLSTVKECSWTTTHPWLLPSHLALRET